MVGFVHLQSPEEMAVSVYFTIFIGEQPNPWNLLQLQEMMSRPGLLAPKQDHLLLRESSCQNF